MESNTLLAGHRAQSDGPVSEAIILTEREGGKVELDLAIFDESQAEGARTDKLVSRSAITIPAGLMQEVVKRWMQEHPEGVTEEQYSDFQTELAGVGTPAADYLGERLGA